jgi:hypothetical protein
MLIVATTSKGEHFKVVDVFYVKRHRILSDFNPVSATRSFSFPGIGSPYFIIG